MRPGGGLRSGEDRGAIIHVYTLKHLFVKVVNKNKITAVHFTREYIFLIQCVTCRFLVIVCEIVE